MTQPCGKRLLPLLCLCICAATVADAQNSNTENAPYSRFGIGELKNANSPLLRGMGSISTGYSSSTAVNPENPASYSFLKLTTYEAGAEAGYRNINTGVQTYTTGTASLSYLTVGIPLGRNGGMAIGLRPQSRTFYHIADSGTAVGIGNTVTEFEGDGGLNYAYAGFARRFKGFSVGFNAGYSFGTSDITTRINNIDTTAAQNTEFIRSTKYGGFYWKGGLQYETLIRPKTVLRLGATVALKQDLNASRDDYGIAYRYIDGGSSRIDDSVYATTSTSGTLVLPAAFTFGAMVVTKKYSLGIDVQHTNWSDFRNFGMPDSVADGATRFGIGGEYTPDATNIRKYLRRITYRIGFVYGTDYVKLHDTQLKSYALTFGASLPFKRSTDRIHTAFEIGSRGTTDNNLIQEGYFRFSVGISLNDRWFIKRRYD